MKLGPVVAGGTRDRICKAARDSSASGSFKPVYWQVVHPQSDAPTPIKTKWCGIFATWIWSRAGLPVEWEIATPEGKSNGPYLMGGHDRIKTSTDLGYLAPGDILVRNNSALHHRLVLSISDDEKTLEVLEGNYGDGAPQVNRVRRGDVVLNPARGAYYYYSVDSYTQPGTNYGNNIPGHR
jgi:hypothetical protein